MPTKSKADVISLIWAFVQKEEITLPTDMRTKRKEIVEAVFKIDGELRISGETGNNFSDMYVNYWDGEIQASELLFYLAEHRFETDWACPGYMVVGGK